MEPPTTLDAGPIRNEKVKFLESLTKMDHDANKRNVIRGQYGKGILNNQNVPSYRNEPGIHPASNTETYVAMQLSASNFRWAGTPFYLRTGKRMEEKTTSIVLEFKSMPEIFFFKEYKGMQPNLLEIRIQPKEGISFSFNAKKPGTKKEISNVKMDFCQNCTYENNSPESYERLISDALRNDQTLFTSWEEIEASWKFVDNITDVWQIDKPSFPNYPAGTWGPREADKLLANNGHQWWNI
jgi:glucose-6-phosphate 1-dehydrogenase